MIRHQKSKIRVESLVVSEGGNELSGELYLDWEGGFVFPRKTRLEPSILPVRALSYTKDGNVFYHIIVEADHPHQQVIDNITKQIGELPSPFIHRTDIPSRRFISECKFKRYRPTESLKQRAIQSGELYTLSRLIRVAHDIVDPSYKEMELEKGKGIPVGFKPGTNAAGHYLPPGVSSSKNYEV